MENWKRFYAYKTSIEQVGYRVTENEKEARDHYLSTVEYAETLDRAIESLTKKYPYSGGFYK